MRSDRARLPLVVSRTAVRQTRGAKRQVTGSAREILFRGRIMRSMRIRALLLGVAMAALAWGADPFTATWKLRAPTSPLESSILQITSSGVTHRLAYRMTYAPSANVAPVVETFV